MKKFQIGILVILVAVIGFVVWYNASQKAEPPVTINSQKANEGGKFKNPYALEIFYDFQEPITGMCNEVASDPYFTSRPKYAEKASEERAKMICSEFVTQGKDILSISENEKNIFLTQGYNDTQNSKKIEEYIKQIESSKLQLPYFTNYFIKKYQEHKLSGATLEIATRVQKAAWEEIFNQK